MKAQTRLVCMFLMLGLSGCPQQSQPSEVGDVGDDSGTPSSASLTGSLVAKTLVDVASVGSDDECVNGGVHVSIGLDDDGDDQLERDEVERVVRICNGATGATGADGADGADGSDGADGADGIDGVDGMDGADGMDGVDGANGAAGSDGLGSLIRVSAAEPSAACPAGGSIVETGIDSDSDGVLADEEVDSSALVCNGQDGADGEDAATDEGSEPCSYEARPSSIRVTCESGVRDVDVVQLTPVLASASSILDGSSPAQALWSDQAGWMSEIDSGNPEWLRYDFGAAVVLTRVRAYMVDGVSPMIQGSNDGETWTDIQALGEGSTFAAGPWRLYASVDAAISTTSAYRYVRMYSEPTPFLYYAWLAFDGAIVE